MTIQFEDARNLLKELGFDEVRYNVRSTSIFLALLNLTADKTWSQAENPRMGITPIMTWVNQNLRAKEDAYKPNSRESFRKHSIHQFVEAGLVERNSDKPERPTNDGNTNYRITSDALELIKQYQSPLWETSLAQYLNNKPGLLAQYKRSREMELIPVNYEGVALELSAGGQNKLIKDMLEQFCPRYAPGAELVYIGDTAQKMGHTNQALLEELGINIDSHGKAPDLIVYLRDKNWLFLMEACYSGGPVDEKRYSELTNLFGNCTAGLVFVTAFTDRAAMRRYLADISWESEAWCADTPDHMVHFNGSRFLGPYSDNAS